MRTFQAGAIVATSGAIAALTPHDMAQAIKRHMFCDWGDCDEHDWKANNQALTDRERLFSVYHAKDKTKFYIVTEADRSVTTILLPDEY
jgi:hypothetical protein